MNGGVRSSKVMRLSLGRFLCGKGLVQFICALAVAMTSFVHVEACFASVAPERVAFSVPADDDQGSGDQLFSECCHFCSGAAIANPMAPAPDEAGCSAVPSSPARSLIAFELPATGPPPKA